MKLVEIYTAVSCFADKTNGGSASGYGIVIVPRDGNRRMMNRRIRSTTNHRAELIAVINALKAL
ncbi:MAG: RNase H family protein, partial [Nitrososphaerales archaeon]